ncbi:hypothetical protein M2141_001731 [Lachnospiraceae bacterium PH5-48]
MTKGKPFTRILANCLLIIGGIFTISAFITPHLSGLKIGAYEIFHMKGFTICDGKLLILGIAIVTIGYAAKYGLELQEVDDTLV